MIPSIPPTVATTPPGLDWNVAAPDPAPADSRNVGNASVPGESDREAFAALMQSSPANAARLEPGATVKAPSLVEKFATTQNADMRELLQSARDLVQAAPHLSMGEMMAFGNELTLNMAVTTTQYNVAGNLGKSAGKGIDTLMRNQ